MIAWGKFCIGADNLQDALEAAYWIEREATRLGNVVTVPDYDFDAPVGQNGREYSIPVKFIIPDGITKQAALGFAADAIHVAADDPRMNRLPARLLMTFWDYVTE